MNDDLVILARAHAPILLLVVPLTGAALAALSLSGRLAWLIATLASAISAAAAIDVAIDVQRVGARLYNVSDWGAPWA